MSEIPIKSIKQAEEYFKAMGCLHFHMAREFPQRYEEYKELNITKEQEIEWVLDQFEEYYGSITQGKSDTALWIVHSRMAELLEQLRIEGALIKMLEGTQYIRGKIPSQDGVIVSETINGRSNRRLRRGLIYLSYDLDNKKLQRLSLNYPYTFRA